MRIESAYALRDSSFGGLVSSTEQDSVRGKVVVAARGGTTFAAKARQAQVIFAFPPLRNTFVFDFDRYRTKAHWRCSWWIMRDTFAPHMIKDACRVRIRAAAKALRLKIPQINGNSLRGVIFERYYVVCCHREGIYLPVGFLRRDVALILLTPHSIATKSSVRNEL